MLHWVQLPAGYGPYMVFILTVLRYIKRRTFSISKTSHSTGIRIAQETVGFLMDLTLCRRDAEILRISITNGRFHGRTCTSSPQAQLQPQDNTNATTNYPDPNHIQVLVIGAQVNSVYDQTASSPVTLIPNGDIVAGQAVQSVSGNGLFTSLYLPVADTYHDKCD